jgi:alkyl hydroperoxide reductase subunit AhpC/predicted Ser/Thr protein kinase
MPLVSYPAPPFAIPAVSIKSPEPQLASLSDYAGHWLLLFFYPRDFSFVCPTELTSLSARSFDFEQRHCRILGVSVDSIASHVEWLSTPAADGGLGPLQFPLASDPGGEVAKFYGVWLSEKGVSARGLFLIDPQGVLQYSVVHNLSVGRSVDEVLRLLDAMQSGGLCPASWTTADGNIDPEKALQPGKVLGHYRIQRLLGAGKFGTVFAAWDLRLERHVALKVLKRNAVESREAILREARTAAPLSHPNVCRIYAVDEEDGLPVIAMEYIDGRPLTDLFADSLSIESKVRLAGKIASGLVAAHALQIVHGDLKPANILVTRDLTPRILDFGLSRRTNRPRVPETPSPAVNSPSNSTTPAQSEMEATVLVAPTLSATASAGRGISGTPAYMSPEQWTGDPATPASDIFSFGLIFFELMTGRRALSEETLTGLRARLRDPQFPVSLASELPESYRETLIATLAMDPTSRPTAERLRISFRE